MAAIRSFYATFDITVVFRRRERLPRLRVQHPRKELTNLDVRRLVEHTSTPRDRAIILTLFQSGMDVSTLCSLKYENVAEGLAKNEHPLKLKLYRKKSGTEYYTFLGADAINAYLNDLKAKGVTLRPQDPLFVRLVFKAGGVRGIRPIHVQNMMREVAVKSGLLSEEELKSGHFNTVGPHALREALSSILSNKGVPDALVDFWLGHEVGEMAEAYKRIRFEEAKETYLRNEQYISIYAGNEFTRLKEEVERRNREMQRVVSALTEKLESLEQYYRSREFLEGVYDEVAKSIVEEIVKPEVEAIVKKILADLGVKITEEA